MPFVVDASVIATWAFQDEQPSRVADLALERIQNNQAVAPFPLWYELRNIFVVNERRGRITPLQTEAFLVQFSTLGSK